MATITERFGFTKPAGSDPASVVPLNSNIDLIELYLGRTQDSIAPMYDDTETYDVGDIVTYESNLYKCITAISTAETFDPTKWEATTAVEEGSGGGGGSSVIPNPTGTPTDTLSTISIDGTIFDIEGSGESGSGYTETTLWSGSVTPSSSETVTLDSSLSNYDFIAFEATISGNNGCLIYPASYIMSLDDIVGCIYSSSSVYGNIWIQAIDNMSISLKKSVTGQNVTYTKIVGIKIESSGGISEGEGVEIYSQDEYIVGKWIDGKKLYQKTFYYTHNDTIGDGYTTIASLSDADYFEFVECSLYNPIDKKSYALSYAYGSNTTALTYDNGDIKLRINNDTWNANWDVVVTVRYTKTVETPAPAWGGSVINNYANFIDTDNIIDSGVYNPTTPLSYTATEDCFVVIALIANNNPCIVSVDNKEIYRIYDNGIGSITVPVTIKKGQTITATTSYSAEDSPYTVYGITYASGGSETPATDASEVEYDNTTSQLTADNVQEALDEVVANADTASEDILTLQNVQGYDAYDETQTYAVGDYAIYNNHVYECTTAVSTAEPFDSTKWSQTSIEQIIDGVKGDVSQLNSSLNNKSNNLLVEYKTIPLSYASETNPVASGNVNVSKTGYTALGVVGYQIAGTSSSLCFVPSLLVSSNNTLTYTVRVTSGGTYSHTLYVFVLYVKN